MKSRVSTSSMAKPAENDWIRFGGGIHEGCVICSSSNRCGLDLRFALCDDGSVLATFRCQEEYQGYRGRIHGGVIASMMDGAMTNCLFAHGHVAYTAELTVRFLHPVVIGESCAVRAWITRTFSPLRILSAEVTQNGCVVATAVGKFMEQHDIDSDDQGWVS